MAQLPAKQDQYVKYAEKDSKGRNIAEEVDEIRGLIPEPVEVEHLYMHSIGWGPGYPQNNANFISNNPNKLINQEGGRLPQKRLYCMDANFMVGGTTTIIWQCQVESMAVGTAVYALNKYEYAINNGAVTLTKTQYLASDIAASSYKSEQVTQIV